MCKKTSISCLSQAPQLGTEPPTQACALIWNQTGDSLLCERTPNQPSHTGQGISSSFKPTHLLKYFEGFSNNCGSRHPNADGDPHHMGERDSNELILPIMDLEIKICLPLKTWQLCVFFPEKDWTTPV